MAILGSSGNSGKCWSCERQHFSGQLGLFRCRWWDLTRYGESRGERQARSSQNQENNLSDQSELRELRRSAQRVRSPLSCSSRVSPLALAAQVVLLILPAVRSFLVS
jgi:hypothetical protein